MVHRAGRVRAHRGGARKGSRGAPRAARRSPDRRAVMPLLDPTTWQSRELAGPAYTVTEPAT
ncbi:hypothetical protein ACPF8X_39485, partial [Streptomyces sp. G35A]